MKLAVMCKWPPFVGGETTKAYFMVKSLTKYFKIDVFSCGWELKTHESCKIPYNEISELTFDGKINLFSSSFFQRPNFIPEYNPLSEKISSLFIESNENEKYDVILAWYLLPFGVAAYISSKTTKVPYIVQHAGSDISRIFSGTRILQPLLIEVFRNAKFVFSYPGVLQLFRDVLRIENIVVAHHHYLLDPKLFRVDKKDAISYIEKYLTPEQMDKLYKWNEENRLIILKPGKLSRYKGIKEFLDILSKKEDLSGIIVGAGKMREFVIKREKTSDNLIYVDAVPPWSMPYFYSISNIVLHLEINFPVKNHRSLIPLDAQLSGKPVISNTQSFIINDSLYFKISNSERNLIESVLEKISKIKTISLDEKRHEKIIENFAKSHDIYVTNIKKVIEASAFE
ncbi:MAG: glycosyltransferase [Candidatus Aenigmarchaeota archaeon]|nr:glycosyltransferase [Candidatus Aenigmarchaeota archaeon]